MDYSENLKDGELIRLSRKGDEAALEVLIKRYLTPIYNFSRQYAGNPDKAADIAQETFIKVWHNLSKFDRTRPFKPWLYAIAKNTALDWLKKREEIPFSFFTTEEGNENPLFDIADPYPRPDAVLEMKIAVEKMDALAGKLPERYQSVITMREKEDLTFKEIAKKLKKPINTIKSHYWRAIRILRDNTKE
jgi:RNA polymerase sigma-70 factor (ECF subfamily)